jgi:hypothetical protein
MASAFYNAEKKQAAIERSKLGQQKRADILKLKKLTSGVNFKNGNLELNVGVLQHEEARLAAMLSKRKKVDRKAQKQRFDRQTKAQAILQKPQESWKVADYRLLCVWKRQKEDEGVTKMALDKLKKEWDRRKNRPVETEEPPVDDNEVDDDEDDDDEMLNDDDVDFHAVM